MRRNLLAGLAAIAVLTAGACAQPYPPPPPPAAFPYPPVPPPRAEVVPPSPPGPLVWQAGHWHWDGREYAWVPGRWIPRPVVGERFVPGRWAWGYNGWAWIPGHWR